MTAQNRFAGYILRGLVLTHETGMLRQVVLDMFSRFCSMLGEWNAWLRLGFTSA
jgi:hypothetical protein